MRHKPVHSRYYVCICHSCARRAYIQTEQLLNLLLGEIQSRLVLGHSSVGDEAIYPSFLLDDLVDGGFDAFLLCDVGLDVFQVGVLFLEREKVLGRVHQVERVDDLCRVLEADLGNAESDATVGLVGFCEQKRQSKNTRLNILQ
jgi:hypothetical protein